MISLLPAMICFSTPLIPARRPFVRDNLFYIFSCSLFFMMTYGDGFLQWYESLILLFGTMIFHTYLFTNFCLSLCAVCMHMCVWQLVSSSQVSREIPPRS